MFGYKVSTGTATTDKLGRIIGEYIFEGKRGATYLSVRYNADDKTLGFYNPRSLMNPWVALKGNYTVPADRVAAVAVTFTDVDKVA